MPLCWIDSHVRRRTATGVPLLRRSKARNSPEGRGISSYLDACTAPRRMRRDDYDYAFVRHALDACKLFACFAVSTVKYSTRGALG